MNETTLSEETNKIKSNRRKKAMRLEPCPYCENFEGIGFEVGGGKVQRYNLCPVCGRPYTSEGMEIQNLRAKMIQSEQENHDQSQSQRV